MAGRRTATHLSLSLSCLPSLPLSHPRSYLAGPITLLPLPYPPPCATLPPRGPCCCCLAPCRPPSPLSRPPAAFILTVLLLRKEEEGPGARPAKARQAGRCVGDARKGGCAPGMGSAPVGATHALVCTHTRCTLHTKNGGAGCWRGARGLLAQATRGCCPPPRGTKRCEVRRSRAASSTQHSTVLQDLQPHLFPACCPPFSRTASLRRRFTANRIANAAHRGEKPGPIDPLGCIKRV